MPSRSPQPQENTPSREVSGVLTKRLLSHCLLAGGIAWSCFGASPSAFAIDPEAAAARKMLRQHCVRCHSGPGSEGGEFDVLTHDAQSLSVIKVVFAELHDRMVEGCSKLFFEFSKNRTLIKEKGEKYLSVADR